MFMLNLFNNSVCEYLAIEINETPKSVHLLFLLLKSNEIPFVDISAQQMLPFGVRCVRCFLTISKKRKNQSNFVVSCVSGHHVQCAFVMTTKEGELLIMHAWKLV